MNGLAFADFAFEDVDAEWIENFFLNRAPERTRAVNRIVPFAREQFLSRIGKIKRDLLLVEPFRPSSSTCSSTLNTSGFAFSISSKSTTEYGLRRTASESCPPSS